MPGRRRADDGPGGASYPSGVSSLDQLVRSASLRLERLPLDATIAVGVAVFQVGVIASFAHMQDGREPLDVLGIGLLVAGPLSLYWVRRAPLPVLAFTLVTALAYWGLDYPRGPSFVALLVAFAVAVFSGHRAAAWLAAAGARGDFAGVPGGGGGAPAPSPAKGIGVAARVFVLAPALALIAF